MMNSLAPTWTALWLLLLSLITTTVTGQEDISANVNANTPSGGVTIVDALRSDPQFSTLVTALEAVEMSASLRAEGPFTLFAPTDNAFTSLTGTSVDRWLQQPTVWAPQVVDLLSHHVLEGEELLSMDLNQQSIGEELYSAQGSPITIASTNPLLLDDDIAVIQTDILASNGVLHSLQDSPLLTPSASRDLAQILKDMTFLSTFNRLLDEAGLLEMLEQEEGPITLFAPTNEAFENVPAATFAEWKADPQSLADALLFHMASGNFLEREFRRGGQAFATPIITRMDTLNTTVPVPVSHILVGDTLASNGVLHMMDRLQTPPANKPPIGIHSPTSIVGILQARGEFNMLLDSLDKVDRLEDLTLNGPQNPMTVFAVRDASFVTDLPEKFLDETWHSHLINVLTYHIVRGNLLPSNFTSVGQSLPTLNFNSLSITSLAPALQVNNIAIVETIQADNGVIHIVEHMILPPSATAYVLDLYALFPEFQTLLDRIGASNLTVTLGNEGPMTVFSPVDGAFKNLVGDPDLYQMEDPEVWKEILMYHIVPGELINFADLAEKHALPETLESGLSSILDEEDLAGSNMMLGNETAAPLALYTFEVTTLQGSNITLTVTPNSVGSAKVLFEDLLVKNGIVQVIDEVLLPPDLTLPIVPVVPLGGEDPTANVLVERAGTVRRDDGDGLRYI